MMDDKTQFESGDEVDSSRHIGCMCQQRNGMVYSAVRSRGLLLLKVLLVTTCYFWTANNSVRKKLCLWSPWTSFVGP